MQRLPARESAGLQRAKAPSLREAATSAIPQNPNTKRQTAGKYRFPEVRSVRARNFQLPGGEFNQLVETAAFQRGCQALRDKLDRQRGVVQHASQSEIVRDCAAPVLADFQPFKCFAPDSSRAAPTEILVSLRAQRRSNRSIPNRSQVRSRAARRDKPAITRRRTDALSLNGATNDRSQCKMAARQYQQRQTALSGSASLIAARRL